MILTNEFNSNPPKKVGVQLTEKKKGVLRTYLEKNGLKESDLVATGEASSNIYKITQRSYLNDIPFLYIRVTAKLLDVPIAKVMNDLMLLEVMQIDSSKKD